MREIAIGVITAWAGAIGNIPPGWHLCDGTHETPDLRTKFVIATGPLFAVGTEGGAFSHAHELISDGHQHVFPIGSGLDQAVLRPRLTNFVPEHATTGPVSALLTYYALAYIMYRGPD